MIKQDIHNCLTDDIKKKCCVDPYHVPHMLYSWEYFSQGVNLLQFISNCAASVLKHSFVNML